MSVDRCGHCGGNFDGHSNLYCCPEPDEDFLGYVGVSLNRHKTVRYVKYTRAGGPYSTVKAARENSRCGTIRELRLGKKV